jgi:UDP-GlcNAc:undecaprenyl-phosphate/decaprenyl-phosphate GlcNAc-1-phosphate transferase
LTGALRELAQEEIMPAWTLTLVASGLALALALVLTPVVGAAARRWGAVARPRSDRWHRQPTALFGGVAIFPAVAIPYLVLFPQSRQTLAVFEAGALLWGLGLLDDVFGLRPYKKLIGQVMGATVILYHDLYLPWTPYLLLNTGLTLLWLVGITNAVNLLDNMDGLSAGIAMIASIFLGLNFLANGQPEEAALVAAFAAALVGFLVYNTNPASIFMGDCGSLFVGIFLAGTSLIGVSGGRSRGLVSVLAVPVLTLLIPIFDTTLVTVLRKLAGRAVSQGGSDHASHRLVALGLSERRAVWLLYGLAILSGVLSLLVSRLPVDTSLAAILSFTVGLTLLAVYLSGVKVYSEEEMRAAISHRPVVAFLIDLSYKRRFFEVLLDVALIILSYYFAYGLLFGSLETSGAWDHFIHTVSILVFVKMAALLVTGAYRGMWRYISLEDAIVYAKAVLLGSFVSVLMLVFAFRFEGYSRRVFFLDGFILLGLLLGSRLAFRLFRKLLPTTARSEGRRVLIYGAGDAGELLLREMRNNIRLGCIPIGFADDDARKHGAVIRGLRVFGGNGSLGRICAENAIDEVFISSSLFTDARVKEIVCDCEPLQVLVKRMRIEIESVAAEVGGPLGYSNALLDAEV